MSLSRAEQIEYVAPLEQMFFTFAIDMFATKSPRLLPYREPKKSEWIWYMLWKQNKQRTIANIVSPKIAPLISKMRAIAWKNWSVVSHKQEPYEVWVTIPVEDQPPHLQQYKSSWVQQQIQQMPKNWPTGERYGFW